MCVILLFFSTRIWRNFYIINNILRNIFSFNNIFTFFYKHLNLRIEIGSYVDETFAFQFQYHQILYISIFIFGFKNSLFLIFCFYIFFNLYFPLLTYAFKQLIFFKFIIFGFYMCFQKFIFFFYVSGRNLEGLKKTSDT